MRMWLARPHALEGRVRGCLPLWLWRGDGPREVVVVQPWKCRWTFCRAGVWWLFGSARERRVVEGGGRKRVVGWRLVERA